MPFNVVTFWPDAGDDGARRIALTLDGPWRYGAGLKADTNTARVPWPEFEKLDGNVRGRTGIIEFWYTGLPAELGGTATRPDAELVGWTILEAQGIEEAQTPIGPVRYVEYRLSFQDWRWRFAEPRGGRLVLGHLNAGPAPAASEGGIGGASTNSDPAFAGVAEMTLAQLVQACLAAMPNTIVLDPTAIDSSAQAPREIKWFGSHAPTELDKLLELAGAVYCPQPDGTGRIQKIVTIGQPAIVAVAGADPTQPALPVTQLPEVTTPAIDMRGKTILFSSYPYPIVETVSASGPMDDGWYFVAQDSTGAWRKYADCDLITQGDGSALAAWKSQGAKTAGDKIDQLLGQLYSYIQVDDGSGGMAGAAPAGVAPVLSRQIAADGTTSDIQVTATVVIADHANPGRFINSSGPVSVPVSQMLAGNILHLASPLIQVTGATHDYFADARELSAGGFTATFTRTLSDQAPDGSWRPRFLHLGFTLDDSGDVQQMAADQVQQIVSGGTGAAAGLQDVIVIPRPDFRARMLNGSYTNLEQITEAATQLAAHYLASNTNPQRVLKCRGFVGCQIDGYTGEIQWDQDRCMTTIVCNAWYRPAGALDVAGLGRAEKEAAKEDYPHQAKTQDARTALGELGATRPVMPVGPAGGGLPPLKTPWIVKIGTADSQNGRGYYDGTLYLGALGTDGQDDLNLPESLAAGKACVVCNLDESGDQTNAGGKLNAGSWAAVIDLQRTPNTATDGTDNSQPLAIVRGGIGDMSFVTPTDPPGTQLTADTTSWTRGQDPAISGDGSGCVIYLQTRSFVDGITKEVGMFQRKFAFDGRGLLVSYGAEEKTILDTGVSCS